MNRAVRTALPGALLALLLAAPGAQAHGPREPLDFEKAVLVDHNDDCGSDDAAGLSNCQGTHDLVALYAYEAHDASLGDVVVLRLMLNGGDPSASAPVQERVTLKAATGTLSFTVRTTDNKAFATEGADRVSGPQATGDGSRFLVDATLRRDRLGPVGSALTDVAVVSSRGATQGDFMPGGYHGPVGTVQDPHQGTATDRALSYTLRGPAYYVSLRVPASTTVAAGSTAELALEVANPFAATAQSITLTLGSTPSGAASATFADGATTATVDLAGGARRSLTVLLKAEAAGASGTLPLVAATNLGGHAERALAFTTSQGSAATTTDGGASPAPSRDSPAVAAPLALGLLALAHAVGRRQ